MSCLDATPATFETPEDALRQTPKPTEGDDTEIKSKDHDNNEEEHPAHNPEPNQSRSFALNGLDWVITTWYRRY